MIKVLVKNCLIASLVFSFSYSVPSLTIKLKHPRTMRNYALDQELLIPDTYLPAGTEVFIPDEYIDAHFKGEEKTEQAILKWLADARNIPLKKFQKMDSTDTGNDYFVPIKIKDSSFKLKSGWVTLRSLAKNDGIEFITTKLAPLLEEETIQHIPFDKEEYHSFFNENVFTTISQHSAYCYVNEEFTSFDIIQNLDYDTNLILNKLLNTIRYGSNDDFANRSSYQEVVQNFNRTCAPLNFDKFYIQARKEAAEAGVPLDMLMAVMTQESAGNCNSLGSEDNGTFSVGLFQVNTGSSKKVHCSATEQSHVDEKCLENPYVNLTEGIRILRSKYKEVNSKEEPQVAKVFEELPREQRDKWRKAISAYNGGQGHIYQAYDDILKFNAQYNTQLDPNDWDVRKIFLLRRSIEKKGGNLLKEDKAFSTAKRSPANALSNLIYVETIVSSEHGGSKKTHTLKWRDFVLLN